MFIFVSIIISRINTYNSFLQIITLSKRAKTERAAALAKAMDLTKNPGSYNRATSYGAAKCVKKVEFDKDTFISKSKNINSS